MGDAYADLKPTTVASFPFLSFLSLDSPRIIANRQLSQIFYMEEKIMADLQTVCCMCGDVGFPEKIFRCAKCRFRFQHSYCSTYYGECSEPIDVCDWCHCEERNSSPSTRPASDFSSSSSSRKSGHANNDVRSAYSGDKIKQQHREEGGGYSSEKAAGKNPSPRPTTRRYKLLKDVMC